MRLATGIILLGCTAALMACGASATDQVKAKIDQFAEAAAGHDYKTICDQVLAPSLVLRLSAAGLNCPQAMEVAFRDVEHPSISIGRVTVKGSHATAIALSAASNQEAAVESLDLINTSKGWRLESLGSPLDPTSGGG